MSIGAFAFIAFNPELPAATTAVFEAVAAKRGLSRDEIIRRLLIELAGEPDIIENMLDMPRKQVTT